MRKLTHVTVDGLLGRFEHRIDFPAEWEFVILHGPNGIGKTRLLELIQAVGSDHLHRLIHYPFRSAYFLFSDGSSVNIERSGQLSLDGSDTVDPEGGLLVTLQRPGAEDLAFPVYSPLKPASAVPGTRLRALEHELPIERVEQNLWYDHSHEDYLNLHEIAYRYEGTSIVESLGLEGSPPAFREFLADFRVHLIETQRLIRVAPPNNPRVQHRVEPSTVLRYGTDLTERLGAALADNSRTSQQLDRTFPNRVLRGELPPGVTDDEIRSRYLSQSELREELGEIAVLDTSAADISLPDRDLEEWEKRVLLTYLDDADEKLATFQRLLDRVQLMRRIVNSRFLFKELTITRDQGFTFVTDGGEIGADSLSSGEQHELVLVYDLLFNVEPETTVLIDEPELSLHVSWQQQFLDDIVDISKLASLRFIVATHSPQIVHTWSARMVPLFGDAAIDA